MSKVPFDNLRPEYLAEQIREAQALIERNCRELKDMGARVWVAAVYSNGEYQNLNEGYAPFYRSYQWHITMPAKTIEIEPERKL